MRRSSGRSSAVRRSVEDIGIEVDSTGHSTIPDSGLTRTCSKIERSSRSEGHAAPFEHGSEIDVLDQAVGEAGAPIVLERGGFRDAWQCGHDSGRWP